MKKNNSKIDIVIPWVDGNDPEWLAEKSLYEDRGSADDEWANSAQRFRDWNLMRYWFRGIEKYMPWINKIFFVTWGHVPEWLNTDHEKLVVVNHKDYIPKKYLPTYNSNVIELNYHRIKDLSENFILFNDDVFVISPAEEEQFFKNDKPCYMLLSEIAYNYDLTSGFYHTVFNNLGIINKHFGLQKRKMKDFVKWVNPIYGFRNMLTNLNKFPFKRTVGFKDYHLTIPHKKSVFELLWSLEDDTLDFVCMNRFRSPLDLSNWLMRYWNFMTGEFEPINVDRVGDYTSFVDDKSVEYICNKIRKQEKTILVINDTLVSDDEQMFLKCQKKIKEAFETILPDRCSFEKE